MKSEKTHKLKYIFNFFFLICSIYSFGQESTERDHSFKTENIFMGGSIGLGIGNGSFSVGGNPEIGYTIAKWLDAGIMFNLNYYSFSAEVNNGIRQRTFNYGAGVFTRLYPVNSFFLTVIPEYNIISTTVKDIARYGTGEEVKTKTEAPSLLLGVGYGTRDIGRGNFYTIIAFDAGNNTNSPYIGYYGSKFPILRAGFNIYLSPKRR